MDIEIGYSTFRWIPCDLGMSATRNRSDDLVTATNPTEISCRRFLQLMQSYQAHGGTVNTGHWIDTTDRNDNRTSRSRESSSEESEPGFSLSHIMEQMRQLVQKEVVNPCGCKENSVSKWETTYDVCNAIQLRRYMSRISSLF